MVRRAKDKRVKCSEVVWSKTEESWVPCRQWAKYGSVCGEHKRVQDRQAKKREQG